MINILILNWNSAADVSTLLASLERSEYCKFRVLLIHNATGDEADILQLYSTYKNLFQMHLIINNENYGYAGGNNKGFEYLQKNNLDGDILILNPDILLQDNTLSALVAAKEYSSAGAIMIRTLDEDGKHLYDAIKMNGFKQTLCHSVEPICTTDYAAGSCILLDRKLINDIGLFDERYFMYCEEVDLSLRIKKSNKAILSTTSSYIIRKSNPKNRSPNAIYFSTRNSFLLNSKFKTMTSFSLLNYLFFMFLNAAFKDCKSKGYVHMKSFFNGLKSGLKFLG